MIERMHPREGRFGLTARIVVGSTLLALVVGLAFALVVATGEGKLRLDGAFRQGLPEAYER